MATADCQLDLRKAGPMERFNAYVDGVLSATDAASVDKHLAGCEACGAELEALRQTAAMMARFDGRTGRRFIDLIEAHERCPDTR